VGNDPAGPDRARNPGSVHRGVRPSHRSVRTGRRWCVLCRRPSAFGRWSWAARHKHARGISSGAVKARASCICRWSSAGDFGCSMQPRVCAAASGDYVLVRGEGTGSARLADMNLMHGCKCRGAPRDRRRAHNTSRSQHTTRPVATATACCRHRELAALQQVCRRAPADRATPRKAARRALAAYAPGPGRHRHSTLSLAGSLAAVGCHCLGFTR
jgi:hypothetical protein